MYNVIAFFSTKDRFLRLTIAALQRLISWLYARQDVPVWRSADGRVTPIRKMSNTHLVNAMALLVRQGGYASYAFIPMRNEITRRGLSHPIYGWPR